MVVVRDIAERKDAKEALCELSGAYTPAAALVNTPSGAPGAKTPETGRSGSLCQLLTTGHGARGAGFRGKVTGTGTDSEFRMTAWCKGIHTNGAEGSVLFGVRRVIGKGVLVPNIVSHLLADAPNLIERPGKVGLPAGGVGDFFQDLGSSMSAPTVYLEEPAGFL